MTVPLASIDESCTTAMHEDYSLEHRKHRTDSQMAVVASELDKHARPPADRMSGGLGDVLPPWTLHKSDHLKD